MTPLVLDLQYLSGFLEELGFQVNRPHIIYSDSQAAGHMIEKTALKRKTRHIAIKYRAINLCHARKEIIVNFIPGIENPADLFTKALFGHKWKYIAHKFMHDPLESDYML